MRSCLSPASSTAWYALLALALLAPACDLFGSDDEDEPRLGQVLWSYDLAHPEEIDFTKPAIDGEVAFVAGGRELLCFDLASGQVHWKLPLPEQQSSRNLVVDAQNVYLIVEHAIWAVDKHEGTIAWQTPIEYWYSLRSYVTQTDTHLWVGGSRGQLGRYRKTDGRHDLLIYLAQLKPEEVEQGVEGPVVETSDGYLYVPTAHYVEPGIEGNVLAYEAATGTYRWGYAFQERQVPIPGHPGEFWLMDVDVKGIVVSGDLLIATTSTSLAGLDRFTGEVRWMRLIDDDGFWYPPVLAEELDLVYVGSVAGYVYALEAQTGETIWRSEQMGASILTQLEVQDGRIYVDNGGQIWVLDARTGETLWHGAPPEADAEAIYLSPVAAGGGYMVNVGSMRVYGLAAPVE